MKIFLYGFKKGLQIKSVFISNYNKIEIFIIILSMIKLKFIFIFLNLKVKCYKNMTNKYPG